MGQERKNSWLRMFSALMVAAGFAAGFAAERARAEEQSAAEARKVVARVNGEPIYEDQVKPNVEMALRNFRKYGMREDNSEMVMRIQKNVLDKVIGDELVDQESRKRPIENLDEKVEERVKALEKKYGAGEGMERYLKIRRLTMEDLRKSMRARVRIDEYLKEHGVLEPEIPEDQIREMYDASPESFSRNETVEVSHVLIAVAPDAGDEDKKQARQKAEQVRREILEGKDFAEMAKKHSNCNSAAGGGKLGNIKRGYMPAEFDQAAFALEEGAVSEVVETKFGYHVIEVTDKQPGGVIPYEEIRGFIEKYLQGEESKKKLATHIAELREKSKIEILLK